MTIPYMSAAVAYLTRYVQLILYHSVHNELDQQSGTATTSSDLVALWIRKRASRSWLE
jgi:hypothetical protein